MPVFAIVQIAGSLLVLACFVLAQLDRVDTAGYRYLIANLTGSTVMTGTAIVAHEWGFVFLEGTWALVSAWGVVQRLRGIAHRVVH